MREEARPQILAALSDTSESERLRLALIRVVRFTTPQRSSWAVETLLDIACSEQESDELRACALRAVPMAAGHVYDSMLLSESTPDGQRRRTQLARLAKAGLQIPDAANEQVRLVARGILRRSAEQEATGMNGTARSPYAPEGPRPGYGDDAPQE